MSPIDSSRARDDGPAFPVDCEAYSLVLQKYWDNLFNIVPTTSRPTHESWERLGVRRKKYA
jgi:hypothetical protein